MRHVRPLLVGLLVCGAAALPAEARRSHHGKGSWQPPSAFDDKIAELSRKHNVPERLIHRVIMRESRYNPAAIHAGNFGLMQIRLGTAKTMGYRGSAMGLCDATTNLTYAVPYLANAYAVAGRDEDRAVRLYASGFYYVAKRQGSLSKMQTADAQPDPQVAAYASVPANPLASLFGTVTQPAQAAFDAAQAESAANARIMAAAYQAEFDEDVPLPPQRPRAYSTNAFVKLAMAQDPGAAPAESAAYAQTSTYAQTPAYAYGYPSQTYATSYASQTSYAAQSYSAQSYPAQDPARAYAPAATVAEAAQPVDDDFDAPLPPRRPHAYSTKAFIKLAMQQEEGAARE